ncbi:hypothetical protein EDC15_1134 [Acetobacter aceti NBRC 14818]|nr:hypothetical protein EDC15_1134 [Acetobacter aceti NBRC 14818]
MGMCAFIVMSRVLSEKVCVLADGCLLITRHKT